MIAAGTMQRALEPTSNPAWVVDADGYAELREATLESRIAISNGFLGLRSTRPIGREARWVVPLPHTYVAGPFETLSPTPATPKLVQAAEWLQIHILLPTGPLLHQPADASSHHIYARRGAGSVDCRMRLLTAPPVGIRLRSLRAVSLSERTVGLQLIQLEIEDGEVELTFEVPVEVVLEA
jgi:trehalose/maltose hydrolase-like predicted phosphorylase